MKTAAIVIALQLLLPIQAVTQLIPPIKIPPAGVQPGNPSHPWPDNLESIPEDYTARYVYLAPKEIPPTTEQELGRRECVRWMLQMGFHRFGTLIIVECETFEGREPICISNRSRNAWTYCSTLPLPPYSTKPIKYRGPGLR